VRRPGLVLGAALLLLAGCGSPRGGDPGNRRLHELAADSIFTALPPGATRTGLKLIPAAYRAPAFEPAGWDGPGLTLTFESAASPISVYSFYGRRARVDGWTAGAIGALHVTDAWRKRYPNNALATLFLWTPRSWVAAAGPREYHLEAGISLPS
jgi:hypothetical protein